MARATDEQSAQNGNVNSDILGALSGSISHIDSTTSQIKSDTASLKSIYDLLNSQLSQRRFSQSSANDYVYGSRNSDDRSQRAFDTFRDRQKNSEERKGGTRDVTKESRRARQNASQIIDPKDWNAFVDSLQTSLNNFVRDFDNSLQDGLEMSELSTRISRSTQDFARDLDTIFKNGSRRFNTRTTAAYEREATTQSREASKKVNNLFSGLFDDSNYKEAKDKSKDGLKKSKNAFEELDDKLTEQLNKFSDGMADGFKKSLQFESFQPLINDAMSRFAESIGSDTEHASEDFGRQLSQALFQESGLSKVISQMTDNARTTVMRSIGRAQGAFFSRRNSSDPDDPNAPNHGQPLNENQQRVKDAMDRIREAQEKRMADRSAQTNLQNRVNTSSADGNQSETISNITEAINNSPVSSNIENTSSQLAHISESVDAILHQVDPDYVRRLDEQTNNQESSFGETENPTVDDLTSRAQQNVDVDDIVDVVGPQDGGLPELHTGKFASINNAMSMLDNLSGRISDFIGRGLGNLGNAFEEAATGSGLLGNMAQGAASALGTGAGGAGLGGAFTALAGILGPVIVGFAALEAGQWLLQKAIERLHKSVAPAKEAFDDFKKALEKTGDFYWAKRRKRIETEQERIQADIETMVKKPFEIMEEAAQAWYDTWDQNLRTITGTQGYTKADLQDLMASYAERLREEGLGDIVSAADMTSQLAKVLEAGLSGTVAEEFAYLATKLNAAIPNQDFFGYAAEYSSVAANAIQAGMDQASAIQLANSELEQFASNILYASRMISGGFSTGLQNAQDLFAKANQIARSAGLLDSSNISAVLTSVSSAVSAVAPQLADGLVSSIVDAAIGENSETLTALRSLANTGASTTAFLREFANDPQGIFTTIFKNLSNLQNMSPDNYMEVAQSLSSIFGIDAAAFSQIDFSSLANSVKSMKVNNEALGENMSLLLSGETTTNEDQLRMQQINEMILNEGLSYVLDNEAARTIQEHMWDQELAQELMENTYGVELEGATFKLLEGIKETVYNIFNLLNPFAWVNKALNAAAAVAQTEAMKADIKRMLELGKVGAGNAEAFNKLTTYSGELLNNVDSLVEMMEGTSGANFTGLSSSQSVFSTVLGMFAQGANTLNNVAYDLSYMASHPITLAVREVKALNASLTNAIQQSSRNKAPESQYNWAYVGKSVAEALQNTSVNAAAMAYTGPTALAEAQSVQEAIQEDATAQMQAFLETMEDAAKYQIGWEEDRNGKKVPTGQVTSMSYDEWVETAADFGIEDLEQALADYGMTEEQLRGSYEEYQAAAASEYNWQREMYEWAFWEAGINFWENAFPDEYRDPLFERFDQLLELTTHIDEVLTYWEDLWQYDWFYQSWSHDWLTSAWNQDWLKYAWGEDWLKTAWYEDWLGDAWAKYWEAWLDWYVLHDIYSEETGQAYQAADVVNASADYTGDAILSLAGALTQNTIDLKDPTVQTNALLAQILIVAEGILQAENTSGSAALATTLAGLSMGFEV